MRTSLFVVACSLTAVFACGSGRNVQKSDTQVKEERVIEKDSSASASTLLNVEQNGVAIWDNETILEIYGDDVSTHRYDGSDSTPKTYTVVEKPTQIIFGEAGIIGVNGNIKRITHKSRGKDSTNSKSLSISDSNSKIVSSDSNKTEIAVKTKTTEKEPMDIPWLGIGLLGAVLFAIYLLIKKAFL